MAKVEVTTLGLDEAGVGTPANDGSRGSSLYSVPIILSDDVPFQWGEIFEANWKQHPSRFRRGVRVGTNRIVFEKALIEEVKANKDEIKEAVKETNERYNMWCEEKERREQSQAKKAAEDRKRREEEVKETNEDW